MINKTDLVSIMMPAYNAENYIEQAIQSVLTQTYPHWELVIVDDGSTDNTAKVLSQYTDPRITVIHQENGGESVARNTALDHMNGSLVAYLDADDVYLPNHLAATVAYLKAHPKRDGVYTDGYHIDQHGNRLKSLSSRRRGPFEGNLFEALVWASDVFGPPLCVVIRREKIIHRSLRYDPRIIIGPDWDFFIQYAEDADFGYIDEATCLYRVHFTNISISVDSQKRASYLALCREKAIRRSGFQGCSLETRAFVFYDLLINLLTGYPERQSEIVSWEEFQQLPVEEQGKLYRLMASEALISGDRKPFARLWLETAHRLNPQDKRSNALHKLYKTSPWLSQKFLSLRRRLSQEDHQKTAPFHDLFVE